MNKATANIRVLYDTFSKTERKIADFLLENPTHVLPLYITELAGRCGASEATIVRFAKRLGYDGYQQLKLAIAAEAGNSRAVGESITESDTPSEILAKVCEDIYCSLEKTRKAIDGDKLERACRAILAAEDILVLGLGNSASVAQDASHKMFRLGLHAHAYTDNHMQAIATAHTNERSVVIGISHSGSSRDIVEALRTARAAGAVTVAITSYERSPINKVSDLVLTTVSDETNYRILGLSSRIAQLAIIDTLYSYLVLHLKEARERIAVTEAALATKKI